MTRSCASAVFFGWAAGACTSKVSQCDEVTAAIERHGRTAARIEARAAEGDVGAGADADALADAAVAIAAIELADPRVAELARQYAALLHETAGVVRAAADGAARRDREAIDGAIAAFDALSASEAQLVADFNAYCQAGE
jgi:hypothetical protein